MAKSGFYIRQNEKRKSGKDFEREETMKQTQEQLREAIMRLSMCARRECEICKYKDRPKTELPSDDCKERATKNMNILADFCLRD